MFDFFKFGNNNRGMIKAGAQGALIGIACSLNQMIDCEEHPLPAAGVLVSLVALHLYLCTLSSTPNVIYKESQPGTAEKENGFYLIEDNSQKLKI
ncbi:hypothetical protein ACD661_11360 [Legionella lytica]|uniref:Transmembrane protein n=1 Tax=Legionella lytica TaxID=96232 RepID=A0ABW8DBF1_9GAMM